jgi:protein O-GlcNAcase/histone acetyltransferase
MTAKKTPAPAFLSGYVEGYYGRLLTFEERLGIAGKLREIGAGHYLYAPKEDLHHRRVWREPYPAAWRAEFRGFVARSKKIGVTVVPGIAPGLSYRYRKHEDFRALARKLVSLTDLGCREAALLMDDIPVSLPEADRGAFSSLGEAHGLILQKLWPLLKKRGMRRLWFCPTVYSDFFAPKGLARDKYLEDLARFMQPGIELFWTGRAIVSPDYRARDLAPLRKITGVHPVIWDNLYANDYCPGKIFLGPFAGRAPWLRKATAGMLLNPTGLYQTDLFLLDVFGGFLRGQSPVRAWRKALADWKVPREFLKVAPLLSSPFFRVPPKGFSAARVKTLRAALKPLIWDWKSPLQREWYLYLYALDADLRLFEKGKAAPDATWIRKKYSPIVAEMLVGKVAKKSDEMMK